MLAAAIETGGRYGGQFSDLVAWIAAEGRAATRLRRGWAASGIARGICRRVSAAMVAFEAELVETALEEPHYVRAAALGAAA